MIFQMFLFIYLFIYLFHASVLTWRFFSLKTIGDSDFQWTLVSENQK